MKVQWLDEALHDLRTLRHHIAQDNPAAARKIVKKVLSSIDLLSEQPGMARLGRVAHTKELVVVNTPYIVPYHVKNNVIVILRVLHSAMQWPDNF